MTHDGPAPVDLSLDAGRLLEAFPEASFVLAGGRIEWVNERFVQLLGHDPTGAGVEDTIPDWRDGLDAEVPFEAALRCPRAARSRSSSVAIAGRRASDRLGPRRPS